MIGPGALTGVFVRAKLIPVGIYMPEGFGGIKQ